MVLFLIGMGNWYWFYQFYKGNLYCVTLNYEIKIFKLLLI